LICNASIASCFFKEENLTWQYNLKRILILLGYNNIRILINEIYEDNIEQINENDLQVTACNGMTREEG